MKHFIFIFLLIITACQPNTESSDDALYITNISIIDPVDGLVADQTVVIKDARIHQVAASSKLNLSDDNSIVDGTGKFLMPGLWDAHVHFAYLEDLAPQMFDLFLAHGVTSVRDTGGKIHFLKGWKDKANANPSNAPRVMIAGPLLDGMPNVYDGSVPSRPPLSVGLESVDDVTAQIHALDSLGVDLLKAYEMLTPEQFSAVTSLAKEKGLKVTGHVPLSMDVISASHAGLNSMEHMRNLELACASNADELLTERQRLLEAGRNDAGGVLRSRIHAAQRQEAVENYDDARADAVLAVLAENDTWQIPTMALNTGSVRRPFAEQAWQDKFEFLPDTIARRWKDAISGMATNELSEFDLQYHTWKLKMVNKVHQAGIPIMAGTDCPIFFLTPGPSLHEELAVLVECGLSPLDAIRTATVNPARYFGIQDELGMVKEQMFADLVLLNSNPLEDIRNTLDINAVIKHGKYFSRVDLDRLLDGLRGN